MARLINSNGRLYALSGCAFEDNRRHCVMLGVTKCDQRGSLSALSSKFLRWPRKNEKRFTTLSFLDIDIAPTHCLADSGAEGLCHRFLGSKTRSQMALWKFHRHRICDLALRENAMQKTIAESINRTPNARALHKINTDAENAHESIEFATMSSAGPKRREDALALQKLRKTETWYSRVARSALGVRGVFAPLSLL